MYPKFKEIALDTATWTVAFLGAIEERETKSKKPFCTCRMLRNTIWNAKLGSLIIHQFRQRSIMHQAMKVKIMSGKKENLFK